MIVSVTSMPYRKCGRSGRKFVQQQQVATKVVIVVV